MKAEKIGGNGAFIRVLWSKCSTRVFSQAELREKEANNFQLQLNPKLTVNVVMYSI
ncbi:hypothetical protein HOLleu_42254 [Holothuria leucospilota]|uniref:Uncharacterized protein n=1 Tax=Holothuria leucospilota TaxID=206669 RepID=A0A9Q1BC93_HOLLE|nr:hypothetical protein HOLleu_42254 [Holothuria leucospilota]